MTIDSSMFRTAMGHFAAGVTIITAHHEGTDHGMTVSSFCSASLDPPLVMACIDGEATLHAELPLLSHFGVSILSEGQEDISRRFASDDRARFDGLGLVRSPAGIALLEGAIAHLECAVHSTHPVGDHTLLVGRVEFAHVFAHRPLVYFRSGYTQLER